MGGPTSLLRGSVRIHPKKSFKIIFANLEYASAMSIEGLDSLAPWRPAACERFNNKARQCPPQCSNSVNAVFPNPEPRDLYLEKKRFNDFVTVKYQ